eukprot:Clim_evm107s88 gene=Clim_evmTU107s88
MAGRPPAFVYDPFLEKHQGKPGGSETPARTKTVFEHLQYCGTLSKVLLVKAKDSPLNSILAVHPMEHVYHIEGLQEVARSKTGESEAKPGTEYITADTYVNSYTWDCARRAAGGLLELIDVCAVLRACNGFALIRPLGHHCSAMEAGGFCYLNNVAIGVRTIQAKNPPSTRIAIFDWDVHHGNGTEEIFYDDPNVLYISIHRYDDGDYYPGTGAIHRVGNKKRTASLGKNVNLPINPDLTTEAPGRALWIRYFTDIVLPIISQFEAEYLFVSAGFDALEGDPKGGMGVKIQDYISMARHLIGLRSSKGRTFFVLEGGYNTENMPKAIDGIINEMLRPEVPLVDQDFDYCKLNQEDFEMLSEALEVHKRYWNLQ